MDENAGSPKELSDSERLKILENEINKMILKGFNLVNKSGFTFIVSRKSKIGFWAWFLIGGLLIFIPVIGPILFGIWTIYKLLSLVNRKDIRKSYGIDKYGVLREVDF
jgi:hypothetical protein